jgi:Na+/H+ antiporter NhaD/arsenite permease-like protein
MILAAYSGMTFNDFFWFMGRFGLFFAVQLAAVASALVLRRLFRKHTEPPTAFPVVHVTSWVPTILLVGIIVALTLLNLFDVPFAYKAGTTCAVAAIIGAVWYYGRRIRSGQGSGIFAHAARHLREFSWDTVFLLMGLFVLVGSLSEVGLIDVIARAIRVVTGGNMLLTFLALVWISVILSGFIDNIPYVTALVPVVLALGKSMGGGPRDAYVLLFGLLIGATVGGNITPIGASANIVACGLLKKEGYEVKFKEFVKIGLPFTVAAVSVAYIFLWFVWRR